MEHFASRGNQWLAHALADSNVLVLRQGIIEIRS